MVWVLFAEVSEPLESPNAAIDILYSIEANFLHAHSLPILPNVRRYLAVKT